MTPPFALLFEDSRIAVVRKAAGVLSQPDFSRDPDLLTLLSARYRERGEPDTVFPVHRLDRGVGGVMVVARTRTAASALSASVASHSEFEKTYLAVLTGEPDEEEATLTDFLLTDERKRRTEVVPSGYPGAKEAVLSYRTLAQTGEKEKRLTLIRVRLLTGRTHQIRVQFASRSHPLAGDGRYGAHDRFPSIALFAERLSFRHPGTGKTLTFSSRPDDIPPFTLFQLSD